MNLLLLLLAGVPTLAPSELRPGMKGHGLSVFFGTKIERFEAEVIDVMPGVWPRSDMILCRLSGQGLEESGIVAGMSGSPVYIDGKLVGAVAYGWEFAKEPIAGITPIGPMLDIWQVGDAEGWRSGNSSRLATGPNTPTGLRPLGLPLAVSGLTPNLSRLLAPELDSLGLFPVAATGRTTRPTDTAALVPGAAVGVLLVDGDVQFSGIGTLTYRDGDRILAFGHPLFGAGQVRLPLIGGIIHSVLPSALSSFKLFTPTSPIGTVTQDRPFGIGGVIGPPAPMVPLRIELSSPTARDRYNCRVIEQDQLAPVLVSVALADVVYQTEGSLEELTLDSRMTLFFRPATGQQSAPLVIRHRLAGLDPAAALFRRTRAELDAVWNNGFAPIRVDSITFELRLRRGQRFCYLEAAEPELVTVRAGDSVRARLRLRDFRGQTWQKTVTFTVPPTAPAGELEVIIATADTLRAFESMRARPLVEPRSFDRLISLLAESGREDELVIAGYSRTTGLAIADDELPAPPPSFSSVVASRSNAESATLCQSQLFRKALPFDRVVSGSARFRLEVRRQ